MAVDTNPGLLRVGELAKAVGKTVRAMHLYEELGLLRPVLRSSGGYRLYRPDAVTRVNWIGKLQDMGFSLPEIQGFLRDWEGSSSGPTGMERVRDIFTKKLAETREAMTRMCVLERELEASLAYLASCGTCEPTHVRTDCAVCNHHGHDPSVTPDLVAGLAKPERDFDVALDELPRQREGNR
jgi:DNA-binding transcriptional MerR regulator